RGSAAGRPAAAEGRGKGRRPAAEAGEAFAVVAETGWPAGPLGVAQPLGEFLHRLRRLRRGRQLLLGSRAAGGRRSEPRLARGASAAAATSGGPPAPREPAGASPDLRGSPLLRLPLAFLAALARAAAFLP